MTDAREFSQELVSAKYFANQDRDSDPEVDQPNGCAAPRHSAADQIMRRLTAFVIVCFSPQPADCVGSIERPSPRVSTISANGDQLWT